MDFIIAHRSDKERERASDEEEKDEDWDRMVHFAVDWMAREETEGEVNPSTNTLATCGLQCRQGRRNNTNNNDCLED